MLRSWRSRAGAGGAPIVEKEHSQAAHQFLVHPERVARLDRDPRWRARAAVSRHLPVPVERHLDGSAQARDSLTSMAGDHFPAAAGARSLGRRLHASTSGSAHWVPGDAWRGREPTTPWWGGLQVGVLHTPSRVRSSPPPAGRSRARPSRPRVRRPGQVCVNSGRRPPQRGGAYAAGAPREVSAPVERQCLLWCSR